MGGTKIYNKEYCAACYFRTMAEYPNKKCLLQLTEKCNLHCEHCFVNAIAEGNEIEYEKIVKYILPQLKRSSVSKVTLTGGEPFVYDRLLDVVKLLSKQNISVCICTNASLVTESFLDEIRDCQVHFNVSLDGFSASTHGRFRGNESPQLFERIKSNIMLLGNRKLLKGVLVTPNRYSDFSEYKKICHFAKSCGAAYVLMNPLSQFGRGEENASKAFDRCQMEALRHETEEYNNEDLEMVYIRFPNTKKKPLGECVAGKIMYIFTNGDIAYCPYMVFAARNSTSRYSEKMFVMGNIFKDGFEWESAVKNYKFPIDFNKTCFGCDNSFCKKGCYAARIACGGNLFDADTEICPLQS